MNEYVKSYFHRGLVFGGFGPIVTAIVFIILELSGVKIELSGASFFMAIVSTYVLAFVQAGSSVFNQIEGWPLAKSMAFHFGSLYIVYVLCYLVNSWIPFLWSVILIFTLVFIAVYLVIWFTVYFIVKSTSKKLNLSITKSK